MRGRMGLGVLLLTAAMLAAGCGTPQQREQKKQMEQEKKIAQAEAKKQKEVAAAEAKRQKADAAAEAKRQKEQAAIDAKLQAEENARMSAAAKKQQAEEAKASAAAKAEADQYEKDSKDEIGHDIIRDERHVRTVDRFVIAQSAQGAREDATLSDQHFDGAELNALGRAKLYLMGKAGVKGPVTVFLNSTDLKLNEGRQLAIEQYWKGSAYSETALVVKPGMNDDLTYPVKPGLDAIKRMESKKSDNASGGSGSVWTPSPVTAP